MSLLFVTMPYAWASESVANFDMPLVWLCLALSIGLIWSLWHRPRARVKAQDSRATQQHVDLVADLHQLAILKEEFLANASRRLLRPLAEIEALAQALLDNNLKPLDEATRTDLGLIFNDSRRLRVMVDNLGDLSKFHLGAHTFLGDTFYLHGLAKTVFSSMAQEAGDAGFALDNRIAPDFPALVGDEKRVNHILKHLLVFFFSSASGGTISIFAQESTKHAEVRLRLEGVELDPGLLHRARDAASSARGHVSGTMDGSQLGVVVAARLLAYRGEILSVEGDSNALSFRFYLPRAEVSESNTTLSSMGKQSSYLAALSESVFQILVIDQDIVTRQLLAHYLEGERYHCSEAGDETQARALLEQINFDLVLIDFKLPQMSGYQFCRELRHRYRFHELSVVIMIDRNLVPDLAAGFQSGANDFLAKPSSRELFLARIETHLRLREANRSLEQKVAQRTQQLEQRNQEIVRTQNQLIVQAKMASLGTLTTGIAHEIKNPLNFVTNFAEINEELVSTLFENISALEQGDRVRELLEDLDDLRQNNDRILVHGRRANQIVNSLEDAAVNNANDLQPTRVNLMVDEFTNMAYQGAIGRMPKRIYLDKDYDQNIPVLPLASHNLSRVVLHLVNNAIEALQERLALEEEGYQPYIRVSTFDTPDHIEISVRDNGPGFTAEIREQIFNPFFTTRPQGSGNIGLGLYLSYDIVVHQHHGAVLVESQPGQGSEFRIQLPKTLAKESGKESGDQPVPKGAAQKAQASQDD